MWWCTWTSLGLVVFWNQKQCLLIWAGFARAGYGTVWPSSPQHSTAQQQVCHRCVDKPGDEKPEKLRAGKLGKGLLVAQIKTLLIFWGLVLVSPLQCHCDCLIFIVAGPWRGTWICLCYVTRVSMGWYAPNLLCCATSTEIRAAVLRRSVTWLCLIACVVLFEGKR